MLELRMEWLAAGMDGWVACSGAMCQRLVRRASTPRPPVALSIQHREGYHRQVVVLLAFERRRQTRPAPLCPQPGRTPQFPQATPRQRLEPAGLHCPAWSPLCVLMPLKVTSRCIVGLSTSMPVWPVDRVLWCYCLMDPSALLCVEVSNTPRNAFFIYNNLYDGRTESDGEK